MGRRSLSFAVVLIAVCTGMSAAATLTAPGRSAPPLVPQGGYEVQALVDGFWRTVGDLPCDRHFRDSVLTLPDGALSGPRVRVRLVQHGGGAAHVDQVSLGGAPPIRLDGASEPDALALALRSDHDVLDAFGRTIELTFPSSPPGSLLHLTARVEGEVNEGLPFAFPPENLFQTFTAKSTFYRYRPSPEGSGPAWTRTLEPKDVLDPKDALFAEPCAPTSGHPDGVTYGWVANDRQTLYAAVEFTPDNTRDGDKDFSSVHVERGGAVKEFRVSELQTRWGRPEFVATARAGYHHKLYLFAIPFSELGIRSAAEASELNLAFSAYGTASINWLSPLFHNFGVVTNGTTSPGFTFTLNNVFSENMVLGTPWITRSGPNSAVFPLTPGTCADGATLLPSQTCAFQIAFAPTSVGGASDNLVVYAQVGTQPQIQAGILVQGQGNDPGTRGIPALGRTGLALLALVLTGAGFVLLRRS